MWNSSLVMCALMSLPPLTTCCTSWLILPLCPAIRVERISSRVFTLLGLLQLLPAMTNSSLYLPISRQQLSSLFLRFSLSKYFFPNLLVDCEYTAARCLYRPSIDRTVGWAESLLYSQSQRPDSLNWPVLPLFSFISGRI